MQGNRFLSLGRECRPNPRGTRRKQIGPVDVFGGVHTARKLYTSKEKHSNLGASRIRRPVWIGPTALICSSELKDTSNPVKTSTLGQRKGRVPQPSIT